jgi:hypothetical protein
MNQYNKTIRFFAATLMVGGIHGVMVAGITGIEVLKTSLITQSWLPMLPACALVALFAWVVFTGLRLWQGTPYGRKWATIVFASQIPVLSLPGFRYAWHTGAEFSTISGLGSGSFADSISAYIMSSGCDFYVGTGANPIAIGVNLFAVIALILLINANNSFKPKLRLAMA